MKDILIHVPDLEERTPAGLFGAQLAAAFGASVTGAYVYPALIYTAPAYMPELLSAIIENAGEVEQEALRARKHFVDWMASQGVSQAEWIVAEGEAANALAQAATRHDLLVLDHPPDDTQPASNVATVVLRAGIPCIVVRRHGPLPGPIERVAVGWNGSPEAARALRASLPFVQGKEVLLMTGEVRDTYQGVSWKTPFDVAAYLERHGATVTHSAIMAAPENAGGALLEEAMHFHADLLVMGAYGRNRFSEWLLGGATRYVLTWAEIPLLLQH